MTNERKLTPAQVTDIRRRWTARAATLKAMAAEYGVAPMTIQHIVHWRTYRDVVATGEVAPPPTPRVKLYDRKGDRWCRGCQQYRPLAAFEVWANGKRESRCKPCRIAQTAARLTRRYQDDGIWQTTLARWKQQKREKRAKAQEERRAFVERGIERLRDQGFTLKEIGELAGLRRDTLGDLANGKGAYVWERTERAIEQVLRATMGLPVVGRPRPGAARQPHPDLGLVRARLDRMAMLEELAA